MEGSDYKLTLGDYIRFFTPLISAVCVVILVFAAYKVGVNYACEGGILNKNRCITPKIIQTVQVCEIKGDCKEICKMYEVKDSERLEKMFNISMPE